MKASNTPVAVSGASQSHGGAAAGGIITGIVVYSGLSFGAVSRGGGEVYPARVAAVELVSEFSALEMFMSC